MTLVEHIPATTWHGRVGGIENAFRYGVDYVCLDPEKAGRKPALFSRNRANVFSVRDADHGGAPGRGRGAAWVRDLMVREGLEQVTAGKLRLLTQPRVLGHVFNPVSFWLVHDDEDRLRVVVAEVTNTYGDRHSYLCHNDDLSPIASGHELAARKVFHVSPFQDIAGDYAFRFSIGDDRIAIRIDLKDGNRGLVATLQGPRRPLTNLSILKSVLARPFGSRRVLALIHWQALKLWWKGAAFRARPEPPTDEVSR